MDNSGKIKLANTLESLLESATFHNYDSVKSPVSSYGFAFVFCYFKLFPEETNKNQ